MLFCIYKKNSLIQLQVRINHIPFLHYFPHPFERVQCLKAIEIANKACEFDVDFHIRGGGFSAQSQAAKLALTRALVKKIPSLRPVFMKLNMMKTDSRQTERKHTGLYKARAKYPYNRR